MHKKFLCYKFKTTIASDHRVRAVELQDRAKSRFQKKMNLVHVCLEFENCEVL